MFDDSANSPSKKAILNPEDEPHTPTKAPASPAAASPSPGRLKFKYIVIQKPKNSPLGAVLVVAWLCVLALLVYSSYCNRLAVIGDDTRQQQAQCRADYQLNKCDRGLKGALAYCEQRRKCFEASQEVLYQQKINSALIAGEILKAFAQGAGVYVCAGGLVMLWVLARRQPPREIRKEYLEYQ